MIFHTTNRSTLTPAASAAGAGELVVRVSEMDIQEIENILIKHMLAILIGLIIVLTSTVWMGFLSLVPDELKSQPPTHMLAAGLGLLLSIAVILVSYIFLLKRKLNKKPNFSDFVHDPYRQCWINKNTAQRICEACKTEGKKTPLSKFSGGGWKCPIHPDIVDFHEDDEPILFHNGELTPTILDEP